MYISVLYIDKMCNCIMTVHYFLWW